jgi:hypothetical protein
MPLSLWYSLYTSLLDVHFSGKSLEPRICTVPVLKSLAWHGASFCGIGASPDRIFLDIVVVFVVRHVDFVFTVAVAARRVPALWVVKDG